jgi:hypothetical protein
MKKKKMNLKANELVGSIELDEYRLSSFQGINKKVVKILKKNGINTAKQLLDIGYTKKGRKKLCESTGIEMKYINELIKLSDLARITGVKKIRARLYYTSGLDTLEKIAACDAEKLRRISSEFIRESGFDGTPPTPK